MAAVRPALSAAGCSQCRFLVLNLFTSGIVRSAPVARRPSSATQARIVGALPIRRFSSLPTSNHPVSDAEHGQDARISEEETGKDHDKNDSEAVASESTPDNVPWYLQVEPPTHIAPMEPPPLPDIPADSPPLIGSLLEYAAEEMGLNDLSLLDLRKLDPPPALGPNLFMLFGTARSERHLNVSAGRLVRWLRAKHRVHADADGLLGPNERKTKLRRKARRAKLLGTMGTDDADDGIRTGWICVNLGTIDRSGVESAVMAEDGRVSGFGVSHAGSTIVFQIMTEGRRAEMGLETLWTRAIDRSLSPPPNSDSAHGERKSASTIKPESTLHPVEKAMLGNLHRPSVFPGHRKGQPAGDSPSNQVRFYSTQQLSGSYTEIDPLSTSSPTELARILTYDAHQKQRVLGLLRAQLEAMDAQATRAALASADGSKSTSFLELMSLAMETLSPARTWEYRLAVQHKASVSGLLSVVDSQYKVELLVEELRIYGIRATRDQYLQLLTCVFCARGRLPSPVDLGLDVINTMFQRNESILTSDIVVSIIEGATLSDRSDRTWARELTARLEKLLFYPPNPLMDMDMDMGEPLLMRLLTAYVNQHDAAGFWNVWGFPPRYLRPRSADLYIHVFRLASDSKSQSFCTQVLRRCVPEAASEDPPVLANEDVRRAALGCIRFADPRAHEFVDLPLSSSGQLSRLAQREFVKILRLLRPST
ncbi:hypothetical protein F4678DRAFT_343304 [Xylaria arbuscula]|nr:hypothetical protein F4678DRAFT_343304 [Xylaria arbuscula]